MDVRAPPAPLLLLLVAVAARADAPEPALEAVREGLLSPGRGAREGAEAAAREMARTDPAGVMALWDRLDLQGRCLLLRALGAAGTRHAAEVALARAGAPEPELFRALLDGLAAGGEASLFTDAPADLVPSRAAALDDLRLRWRLEAELARLKSPSGPTGTYEGQYKRVKELGPGVIPILFDITMDRARPLPGESAAGPYVSIHPGMAHFDGYELRLMTAYAFGEVVEKTDLPAIARLDWLYLKYSRAKGDELRFEREDLAPYLAFGLFDLGRPARAEDYVHELTEKAYNQDDEQLHAMWDLGFACIRIGRYEDGEFWYEQVIQNYDGSKAIAAYNLACNFSMRAKDERNAGRRDWFKGKAVEYLRKAIRDFNYGDWKWMEEDGDLSFIRTEPKYQELLRYLQQKYPERQKGKVAKDRSFLGSK